MAYWDQVNHYKNKVLSDNYISEQYLKNLTQELDIATSYSTAKEKIRSLVKIINEKNLNFLFTEEYIIEIETPFQLAYLFKRQYPVKCVNEIKG